MGDSAPHSGDTAVQAALTACSSFHRWRRHTAETAFAVRLEGALEAATQDEQRLSELESALSSTASEARALAHSLAAAQQAAAGEAAARAEQQARAEGLQRALEACRAEVAAAHDEVTALRERAVAAEQRAQRAGEELDSRDREAAQAGEAAAGQARELRAVQAAMQKLRDQLAAAEGERVAAREAAAQARARAADLEVALADEAMRRELEASTAELLQRQLEAERRQAGDLAEQLAAAESRSTPDLKPLVGRLQEENASLKMQLAAATARVAEFGRTLSRAAAEQWEGGQESSSEGLPGAVSAGSSDSGDCADEPGADDDQPAQRDSDNNGGRGGSAGSEPEEGASQSDVDEGEPDTADSLLHMIVEQQRRIEGLEGALAAAEELQAVAAAVAKQTVQKLMAELARAETAAKQQEGRCAGLEQARAEAQRQREALETQLFQLHEAQTQEEEAKAQQLQQAQEALAQAREASLQAATLQSQLSAVQAQLQEERTVAQQAQQGLAQAQRNLDEQGQRAVAEAAVAKHAAEEEARSLRARLAETEAVAKAVIAKLERRLAAREGTGQEVAAQLQARCAAAVKASKDALATLQAERDLWACMRAAYVQRAGRLRAVQQREILLRKAWARWRCLALSSALSELSRRAASAEAALAAAEKAEKARSLVAPQFSKAAPQPEAALPGLPWLPFTIPAIGPTASPAILAMALLQPAAGAAPAASGGASGKAVALGACGAHASGKSPALQSLWLPSSAGRGGPHPTPAGPPDGLPSVSLEPSEWTTVSTEAAFELLQPPEQPLEQPPGPSQPYCWRPAAAEPALASTTPARPEAQAGAEVGGPKDSVRLRKPANSNIKAGKGPRLTAPSLAATAQPAAPGPSASPAVSPEALPQQEQQDKEHQGVREVRRVPRGAKKAMLTGHNSPAPWMPASRHARILSAFDLKPSPTTQPRDPGDSRLVRGGMGKGRGSGQGATAVAGLSSVPAAQGDQAALVQGQPEAQAVPEVTAAAAVQLEGSSGGQGAERPLQRQGSAVQQARAGNPEGAEPQPRNQPPLPTCFAEGATPAPAAAGEAAADSDKGSTTGGAPTAEPSGAPNALPAATASADVQTPSQEGSLFLLGTATGSPDPLEEVPGDAAAPPCRHDRAAEVPAPSPAAVAAAGCSVTGETGRRGGYGLQIRRVALTTPVVVHRELVTAQCPAGEGGVAGA